MQPNFIRNRAIEMERLCRFQNACSKFGPIVSLGKNALSQGLGYKASICLLGDVENQIVQFEFHCASLGDGDKHSPINRI